MTEVRLKLWNLEFVGKVPPFTSVLAVDPSIHTLNAGVLEPLVETPVFVGPFFQRLGDGLELPAGFPLHRRRELS